MSEVVTGDAVVLDVRVAQLPVRAVSALIDITVILVGYLISLVLWAATLSQFDEAVSAAIMVIFTVLVLVGYPLIFETATRGRTLGKMAMGLRVVSDDGGPERFRQALFRALASVVEIWMLVGSPAVICGMLSPTGQTDRRHFRRHGGDQRTRPRSWGRRRSCRRISPGGRRRCSFPDSALTKLRSRANSSRAQGNSIQRCATRWPTGSQAMC